ncbi:MAG TPA: hypothetical protein VE344_11505 [Methylomirabilota bacterium]|nr:hypothetical protein [Methylomirabilota bacterium]
MPSQQNGAAKKFCRAALRESGEVILISPQRRKGAEKKWQLTLRLRVSAVNILNRLQMVALRKELDSVWVWFYKDVAPTALFKCANLAK